MDNVSEVIQSYMMVVVLFCGFFKSIKLFQLISTIYYCLFSQILPFLQYSRGNMK